MTNTQSIAIVHYHLRPGGVATVIQEATRALRARGCRVAVLSGTPASVDVPGLDDHQGVEGLDYLDDSGALPPELLVERLETAATRSLGGRPDIWHFHNHSLGKNCALSRAVHFLATRGQSMLLQIHDFPEDGRPSNYRKLLRYVGEGNPAVLGERLYPQAGHIHYAVLNGRDGDFLRRAGANANRVHLLPNAVSMPPVAEPIPGMGGQLFLYPTRAIRRKNLGEFLLWSVLGGKGDRFATTLAPTSAGDRASYERWVRVACSLGLPVEFEVGLRSKVPFQTLLSSAHVVATTSVAEGFGLAFLEPWLAGRPLVGRDLPELTDMFKKQGMDFGGLYRRLLVPLAWVGADSLREKIAAGMKSMLADYGREPVTGATTRAFESAVDGDRVDFGRLDEEMQELVLRRLMQEPACRQEFEPPNLLARMPDQGLIEANRRIVEREYNGDQYGRRLTQIYGEIMGSKQAWPARSGPKPFWIAFLRLSGSSYCGARVHEPTETTESEQTPGLPDSGSEYASLAPADRAEAGSASPGGRARRAFRRLRNDAGVGIGRYREGRAWKAKQGAN